MKRNGKFINVKGYREPIFATHKVYLKNDMYSRRKYAIPAMTRHVNSVWSSDTYTDLRVINQGYDKLVEYRVVTGIDKRGTEWETRWYGEWGTGEKGECWVYVAETLDRATWERVE